MIAFPLTSAIIGEWFFHAQRKQVMLLTEKMGLDNNAMSGFLGGMSRTFHAQGFDMYQSHNAATAILQSKLHQQSIMLAGQDLYSWLGVISLVMSVLVLMIKKLDAHYEWNRNRYSLLDS